MEVMHREYSYASTSGLCNIYAQSWTPSFPRKVKAIFQITHGMAEHSNRYENFGTFLAENGIAVFINDHIGHGKSVSDEKELGYFGEEKDSWKFMVEDAKLLTDIAVKEYPDTPIVFFGHSMGSFVARSYTAKYGDALSGAIFCGTSGTNPAAGLAVMIAEFVAKRKGSHYRSDFIDSLAFGSYNKKFKNAITKFDWLSRDGKEVEKYINDDLCGFVFTANGYRDLFSLLRSVSSSAWYHAVPQSLPILIISGSMDPVGEYGNGVRQVFQDLKKTVHDVKIKLYSDARHEILNETNRSEVYNDILTWINNNAVKTFDE